MYMYMYIYVCIHMYVYIYICTANPTCGDIFESSKLKARTSLLPRFIKRDVRALSFELWNSIRKCHPKWDRLYIVSAQCIVSQWHTLCRHNALCHNNIHFVDTIHCVTTHCVGKTSVYYRTLCVRVRKNLFGAVVCAERQTIVCFAQYCV